MKKGNNVLEYAILAAIVGLTFAFAYFNLMIDENGTNKLQALFNQVNQSDTTDITSLKTLTVTD